MAQRKKMLHGVTGSEIEGVIANIFRYVAPYMALMIRSEQGGHLEHMILGLTSDLERKSIEPIAVRRGVERRALQGFMGISEWDHEPLRFLEHREVQEEIGSPDASLIIDGSSTPKKGTKTVGVKRQWCGSLGKTENCVTGVHVAYVGKHDEAILVDSDLFMPEDWMDDAGRRIDAHVPVDLEFKTKLEIGETQIKRAMKSLQFGWVLADEEFGRSQVFRDRVRYLRKYYAVDVPKDTLVVQHQIGKSIRDVHLRVDELADALPAREWRKVEVRDGEKGPITIRATKQTVFTNRTGQAPVKETLLLTEELDGSDRKYVLVHGPTDATLLDLLRRKGHRHKVEEVFAESKGELGMDHFELRSFHGWYHHMTLVQMAHWFLSRERRRLKKRKITGMTMSLVRTIVGKAMSPAPTNENIAELVNYQIRRTEEVRQAHYKAKGLVAPPRDRNPVVT